MLVLPLHVTHNMLRHPITVVDVTWSRDTEGAAVATLGLQRVVMGNLQPAGPKVARLLPEGMESDGLKVLHTDEPIYVADNGQGKQTYIVHGGQHWKCVQVENWNPHAKLGRWLAARHLNIDMP